MTLVAAKLGKIENLEKLLTFENVDDKDGDGRTALIWAAKYGHSDCVKILLGKNANVNICDDNLLNALMYASRWGHIACVTDLLESGTDINQIGLAGETAVILAATWGRTNCLVKLLEYQADISICDQSGKNACHWASQWDQLECLELLIRRGIDIKARDHEGQTSLIFAAAYGHRECVEMLVQAASTATAAAGSENDNDYLEQQDISGGSALYYASKFGQSDIAIYLLEKGANPYLPDHDGWRPRDWMINTFDSQELQECERYCGWWRRKEFLCFLSGFRHSETRGTHRNTTRQFSLCHILDNSDLVRYLSQYL